MTTPATTAAAAPAAPAAPQSLAAIIAELAPEADAADAATPAEPEGEAAEPAAAGEAEGDDGEAAATDDAEAAPATALDLDAIKAAVEAKDTAALLKALGDEAVEAMLGGKAHKTLRRQLRDAETATKKAEGLGERLAEKYGDPIAARKAAEAGDVDSFLDMVEKWAGSDWNTVQRWIAKGLAGRKERLEAKAKTETKAAETQTAEQTKALEETRTWVGSTIKRSDAKLVEQCPEIVDLVIDELRAGLAKGIDSPAKALPLARAKLKDRYERLHAVFGAATPRQRRTPTVKPTGAPAGTGRPMTREEIMAEVKREAGLK